MRKASSTDDTVFTTRGSTEVCNFQRVDFPDITRALGDGKIQVDVYLPFESKLTN
jgi:hypothetical protein